VKFVDVTSDGQGGLQAANSLLGAFGGHSGTNGSALDAPAGFLVTNPLFTAAGAPQNGHSNVGSDPDFSLYTRDGSFFLVSLDPRPAATSPLLPGNGAALTAGAPKPADYQGAFGPEDQWLEGWSWYAEEGFLLDVVPAEGVSVTAIGKVDSDTIFIDFLSSVANAAHEVRSSADLSATPFTGAVTISGGSLSTNGSGVGHVEIDMTGSPHFFQIQIP
jgi:hypothetical protein